MDNTRKDICNIVVSGDLSVDWNIARSQSLGQSGSNWNPDDFARACWQRGGAALLGDLLEKVAEELAAKNLAMCEVRKPLLPSVDAVPSAHEFHHSYALWSPFKYSQKGAGAPAWRVAEYIGFDRSADGWVAAQQLTGTQAPAFDLMVFDDADLGFREHPELWSDLLNKITKETWILLKIAGSVTGSALWKELHRRFNDRLIVVMTVDDLRRNEVQISRGLSWERTAQDLAWELVHNPRINALSDCAAVLVSFHTAGVFLLQDRHGKLFFDPRGSEGSWAKEFPGGMIGYSTCLSAAIARQIMLNPLNPDIEIGIQSGLAAIRCLHREGYGERNSKTPDVRLFFPLALVSAELAAAKSTLAMAPIQDPLRFFKPGVGAQPKNDTHFWTILQDRHSGTLDELARQVAIEGIDAVLTDVPLGQFGNLITVDRQEIESFHSIRALINEYCSQKRPKNPLSIAVFGSPGAGKSFGISEIAKALLPGIIQKLEFNLSQFSGPEELSDALHQVRDTSLAGNMPLVFFDEFDTALDRQPLGWLCHFLAPMQDGAFRHGQIVHPIGPAIFIFAGGTCENMEAFNRGPLDAEFRKVKGTDFVSRLKGFINILGPNPILAKDHQDPYFVLRRAILLRSLIARTAPQLLEKAVGREMLRIDPGVLNALLFVSRYKHGARSIEALLAMSQLSGKHVFERSCLPSELQLDLHVNGLEFLSLVQQIVLSAEILEKLATAAHEIYCQNQATVGFKYGAEKCPEKKTNPLLVDYASLPDWAKEANRVTVRTIPQKLAAAGYVMIPSRSNQSALTFPGEDLDRLAQLEHQLWMESKLAKGFELGKPTADNPYRNEYLVPWENLSEEVREIDRDLIRGVPHILLRAGYVIVKVKA